MFRPYILTTFRYTNTGKGKGHPRTGHEGPEGEWRYSPTLSLTSALEGGGWSAPRPGRFTPGKDTRYPLYRRLGGPQGRSGRMGKISPPPGFDPRNVQPVASRYTDRRQTATDESVSEFFSLFMSLASTNKQTHLLQSPSTNKYTYYTDIFFALSDCYMFRLFTIPSQLTIK
jgi:hypothetical protein